MITEQIYLSNEVNWNVFKFKIRKSSIFAAFKFITEHWNNDLSCHVENEMKNEWKKKK